MIGKTQKQTAEQNATAIQSAGDITVNTGVSLDQMKAIIECVSDQIPKYAAIAREIVDQRLDDFKEKIINKFNSDNAANANAFQDPDFQYLLSHSQQAYARSGNATTADLLIDLIAQRSGTTTGERRSLILNRAAEIVPLLTNQEISILMVTFLLRRVHFGAAKSPAALGSILLNHIAPYVVDLSADEAPYLYLESLGCGKLSMGECGFVRILASGYPEAVVTLPTLDALSTATSATFAQQLFDAGLVKMSADGSGVIKIIEQNDDFVNAIKDCGFDENLAHQAFNILNYQHPTLKEIISILQPHVSMIERLANVWDNSPLKNLELSATGVAIGFTAAKGKSNFSGDICAWVN